MKITKIAGIIAEYHPFHNGHAWQMARLREMGYEAVVCAMSPSVVQRGQVAVLPVGVRAEAALAGGADLVLELPAPCACKSAEGFALAGVTVLDALGCVDALAFGAETPGVRRLEGAAAALEGGAFRAALRRRLDEGLPLAAAREAAAEDVCPGAGALLQSPNNILAVDYCRALLRLSSAMAPLALAREGAGHDAALEGVSGGPERAGGAEALGCSSEVGRDGDGEAAGGCYASATALRRLAGAKGPQALAPFVPPACLAIYRRAWDEGLWLDEKALSVAVLSRLRARERFDDVRGAGEGLANRLAAAVRTAPTLEALTEALKTKRYPTARLRRLVLDAALGYTDALPALPPYVHVLAANERGLAVLRAARPRLPLGAGLAALERESAACAAMARAHGAAEDLAALCRVRPQPCGTAYTHKFLLKKQGGV